MLADGWFERDDSRQSRIPKSNNILAVYQSTNRLPFPLTPLPSPLFPCSRSTAYTFPA
jgi:hypothetical protein